MPSWRPGPPAMDATRVPSVNVNRCFRHKGRRRLNILDRCFSLEILILTVKDGLQLLRPDLDGLRDGSKRNSGFANTASRKEDSPQVLTCMSI